MAEKESYRTATGEDFGTELQSMRNRLGDMATALSLDHPAEVFGLAVKAQEAVDLLRQQLGHRVSRAEIAPESTGFPAGHGQQMIDDIKRKIDHTKYLLSQPVDFVGLAQDGLLVKDGDRYRTSDLNRLPEHVLHRVKFLEQENNVTYLTLNEKGI